MSIQLHRYTSVYSTMDEARRLLETDFASTLNSGVLAEQQQKGRGRQDREWISPKGNLYLTLMLESISPQLFSQYALLWGLALRDAIESILPQGRAQCKWPNDVLIDGKKVGGILIEKFSNKEYEALLVGIGVNIISAPEDTLFPATFLDVLCSPEELAQRIYVSYQTLYRHWKKSGFEEIRERWQKCAWKWGQEIIIRQNDQSVVGIFEKVEPSGAILIKDKEGVHHTFFAGDVFNSGD